MFGARIWPVFCHKIKNDKGFSMKFSFPLFLVLLLSSFPSQAKTKGEILSTREQVRLHLWIFGIQDQEVSTKKQP